MQSRRLHLLATPFSLSRIVALLLVGVLSLTFLSLDSVSAAHADDTQSFSGAPADGDKADSSRATFAYRGQPGQALNDSYMVINDGTVVQDITISATDAFNAEDGSFSLLDINVPAVDVGTWVSFEGVPSQVVTLQPGESKVVPFVVTIPADARPGDHIGGVLATVSNVDGQVKLARRVATRLYVRVAGELQAGLTVSGLSAIYQPSLNPFSGDLVLSYTVQNTGNVSLGSRTSASVVGLFGIALSGKTDFMVPELIPGATHKVTTIVPGVWQWVWMNAKLSLIGVDTNRTINAGVMPTADREASTWSVPWALVILLVLSGFAVMYIRFSHVNNERRSQQWMEYTEAEARIRAREESTES